MVSSPVDVCNLSCDLLQIDSITSIDTPESATEEAFARWYDHTRRDALRRHSWNFASKRQVLAKSSSAPEFGYSSKFELPSDYIRLLYIAESNINYDNPIPSRNYTVEDNHILTGNLTSQDSDSLSLVYVYDFTNVPKMDALFIDYFSTMLAQKLAYSLTQSNTNIQRLDALMEAAEAKARAMDGQENPPKRVERSRHLAARRRVSSPRNYDGLIIFD